MGPTNADIAPEHPAPSWRRLTLALGGGLLLAATQPVPYLVILAINAAAAPEAHRDDPASAFVTFWLDPVRWAAILGFTVVLAVMLSRVGRPSGGYVGATITVSVGAYCLVGAVGQAVVRGAGFDAGLMDLILSFTFYFTAWLATAISALACGAARGTSK